MLVYLYGPPAVGKLTVARRVQELTGFRLFHNHLTVNAVVEVFEFRSKPFEDVLHRMRLDVFSTAASHGVDLIFTNNMAWAGFHDWARQVEAMAGQCVFVQLTAPIDVLCARVAGEDRAAHGKIVDPVRLREQVLAADLSPVHADDLVIDTSVVSPDDAAHLIVERVQAQPRD